MKKDQAKTPDQLEEQLAKMGEMDRRLFLEYSLKLTTLLAASTLIKPDEASAQTATLSDNAPKRFVNISLPGGFCQRSSYLSPLAKTTDTQLNTLTNWKTPGLATSFRPSTNTLAATQRENMGQGLGLTDITANNHLSFRSLFCARTPVGIGSNQYQMPLLWNSLIPLGTNSSTSMKNIISQNCAMIYGLYSSPAHGIAYDMITNPEPGSYTLGGYVHYHTRQFQTLFPCLASSISPKKFKTPTGSGAKVFTIDSSNSVNEAKQVLEALLAYPNPNDETELNDHANNEKGSITRQAWLNQVSQKMMNSLDSIKATNMALKPGISTVYELLKQAKTKVDENSYYSVLQKYQIALAKYKALTFRVAEFARTNIQGLTDEATRTRYNPIVTETTGKFTKQHYLDAGIQHNGIRNYNDVLGKSINNPNYAFGKADSTITEVNTSNGSVAGMGQGNGVGNNRFWISFHMAHMFAFAEVALDLEKPLTNVLSLGIAPSTVGITLNKDIDQPASIQIDNHTYGAIPNMMWTTLFHYAFNSLFFEFIRTLKSTNTMSPPNQISNDLLMKPVDGIALNPATIGSSTSIHPWNDTLIVLSTEFQRNPKGDGTGSDHGSDGCNVTLFGGRINGPLKIYGKTKRETGDTYPGAWGNGYSELSYTDLGVSIAKLYSRGSPHPKLSTLIDRSKILFNLENGTIVFNPLFLTPYTLD